MSSPYRWRAFSSHVTPKSNDANSITGSRIAARAAKTHQAVLKRDSGILDEESIGRSTFRPLEDDSTAAKRHGGIDFGVLSCTIASGQSLAVANRQPDCYNAAA